MRIVVALDVHRRQITYKTLDRESGEVTRGRIAPATRGAVREWLARFAGCGGEFALEGTTGWRFVVEEIERAGHRAHLADPAETAAKRGRKRRAKTDNADCDLQLRLLLAGELPQSWIPPAPTLELRTRVRTRKLLIDRADAVEVGDQGTSSRSIVSIDGRPAGSSRGRVRPCAWIGGRLRTAPSATARDPRARGDRRSASCLTGRR